MALERCGVAKPDRAGALKPLAPSSGLRRAAAAAEVAQVSWTARNEAFW